MASSAGKSSQVGRDPSFYKHTTDLFGNDRPKLCITSSRIPQLKLRLPTNADAGALLRLFSDRRNVEHDKSCNGLGHPTAIAALIEQWNTIADPLERANIVVVIDGKTVGTGGLGWIGRKPDGRVIGDAGLMLDPDFRRQGYAYEALSMVIDHGFRVLNMDEVHIACVDANVAFKGMMNVKFGFGADPIRDEQFGNEWIWRITKEQWVQSPHSAEGREKTLEHSQSATVSGEITADN